MDRPVGLCHVATHLRFDKTLTLCEYVKLKRYINNNRPNISGYARLYFWPLNDVESRLEWLDNHIKLNTKTI